MLPDDLKKYRALTPREAAEVLHSSRQTLCNWRHLGIGPPYWKLGNKRIRYELRTLLEWRDRKRVEPEGGKRR